MAVNRRAMNLAAATCTESRFHQAIFKERVGIVHAVFCDIRLLPAHMDNVAMAASYIVIKVDVFRNVIIVLLK
ncbi:hypothetical protein ANCCEY_00833 [Ancylostoma ceylanicum]|uniref:Uncharacterized protein n=1 Tax=Ancylostoma ceylanicum TaxID=53326 RepID=A0A0D6M7B5_9BILA|nr:hypothetical protein ANCCEY_00833 [Ancylostoma ceylanicum]